MLLLVGLLRGNDKGEKTEKGTSWFSPLSSANARPIIQAEDVSFM